MKDKNHNKGRTIHGMSRTRIYSIWSSMRQRCINPNHTSYYKYGGKGIKVCEEWDNLINGFMNFYNWANNNGYTDKLTIDRIDSKSGYYPENCKWATYLEQNTHLTDLPNNTSGYVGVSWAKNQNKWVAMISINNKSKRIGGYNTQEQAVNARNEYIDRHNLPHRKNIYIGEIGKVNI